MSFYRRYPDGRTERWFPDQGEFRECATDEPETRIRRPNEGMVIAPAWMVEVVETGAMTMVALSIKDLRKSLEADLK
jgi:hypothetical protein